MTGFAIHISQNKFVDFKWSTDPYFIEKKVEERIYVFNNIRIDYKYKTDFPEERLHFENEKYLVIGNGIVSNLSTLVPLKFEKTEFFKEFKGHFAGVIIDKRSGKVQVFNNHTGTQKIFYFQHDHHILISSNFYTTTQAVRELGFNLELDKNAAYLLLSSGFMHENYTLFKDIKQIRAGEYLSIEDYKITPNYYFHLSQIQQIKIDYQDAINKLDEKFRNAVKIEFELDKKYGYLSYTTLSGGLDSRMVALSAFDLGYRNQVFINFSEPRYADELIARKIAKEYKQNFHHIKLYPKLLKLIDENVSINGGLTIYTGASHVYSAMMELKDKSIGILHTGNIGDAVLGSFISSIEVKRPKVLSGLYSTTNVDKLTNIIEPTLSNYQNEEIYKFYNRAFLGANNGFLYYDLVGVSSSPFLDPEFLSFAYSLPREFKFNSRIYIDWIKQKHPEFANYIWEAIGGKPTNNKILRSIYRIQRAIVKRLPLHSMWKNNMNPEQLWYNSDSDTRNTLDSYFRDNISRINYDSEFKEELIAMYLNGDINLKSQVLTLLSAVKLHLG